MMGPRRIPLSPDLALVSSYLDHKPSLHPNTLLTKSVTLAFSPDLHNLQCIEAGLCRDNLSANLTFSKLDNEITPPVVL